MKLRFLTVLAAGAFVSCLPQAKADLRDGLVSYWPLDVLTNDPGSGQNLTPDLSPNGNHLSDNFTMSPGDIVTGVRGGAAAFDGVAKYLFRVHTPGAENGLPIYNARFYTISMWVRDGKFMTGTNQQTRTFFSEVNNANNTPLFRFTTDFAAAGRTNVLAAAIRNNNNSYFFGNPGASFADNGKSTVSTNMPMDGAWHHIAWVDSNGVARLYIDGQLDPRIFRNTRVSEPGDIAIASRDVTLNTVSLGAMAQGAPTSFFHGLVDDVAVWERALSQDEINVMRTNSIQLPIVATAPAITNQPAGSTNLLVGGSFGIQAFALGAHPRSYQWYKDGQPLVDDGIAIFGSTSNLLYFPTLDVTNSGIYSVVISNALGFATSDDTELLVSLSAPQTASLTNGMISYWPLDQVQGITTPDVVRGYDMLLGTGLTAANLVPGKWGSAFRFNTNGILSRIHAISDDLPISKYKNFTVSLWVNAPTNTLGQRLFAEGNLTSANPWLSLGQVDNATQAATVNPTAPLTSARAFVRNDANQNNSTVGITASSVFYDPAENPGGVWRHVVYIQEEVGGAVPLLTSRIYVDGVRDTGFSGSPRLPRSVQNTSIGGALRTGITGQFGGGLIDDVAVWNRALTDEEILMLSTNVTPAAPPVLTPLQIVSFRTDFPEVVSGDNIVLRWNVSSSAAAVDVDQGVGNVLSRTTNGFGSIVVSNINSSRTFTLTIQRGTNVVTAQTSVTVASGVAAGWNVLDRFDTYSPGSLVNPYWSDMNGGASVVNQGANRLLNVPEGGQLVLLPLAGFSINQGQARTVFARVYVEDDPAAATMLNAIGVTDKSLRNPNDIDADVGPIARVNDDAAGDLAIGARNGAVVPANPITLIPRKLEQFQVYNVWIDITNGVFVSSESGTNTGDSFSIWIQRLGETGRTLIASNYTTDRDLEPDFLGATGINLDQLVIGNDGGSTGTVYVDDLFISKSGFNSSVPVPWSGPTPPVPVTPVLTSDVSSFPGQIQLNWDAGALMWAPSIDGPWSVVPDSFGLNYLLTIDPGQPQQFIRLQR